MRLGRMRAHAGLVLAAAGCMALALVLPREMFDGSFVDWRFAIMAALAVAVSVRPELDARPVALAAASLLAVLAIGRTAWIGTVWTARAADVAAVERAIAHLPPGAALLPSRTPEGRAGPIGRHVILNLAADFHYAVLAVPRQRVFVPTLFAHPGQQPVRLHPTWAAIAQGVNQPVPDGMLAELAGPEPPPGGAPVAWRYAQDWPHRFDYLLLLDAEGAALDPAVARFLEPVADEGFARLWRIRK
jgi:hypothetical protein